MKIINLGLLNTCAYVFTNRNEETSFAIISIQEPETEGNGIVFTETKACKRVMNLCFSDIDPLFFISNEDKKRLNESIQRGTVKLFSEEDAKSIKSFFEDIKDNVDTLIVQCNAGVSRSSAIAAVLNLFANNKEKEYFDKSIPNMYIYNILYNEMFGMENPNDIRGNRAYILDDDSIFYRRMNSKFKNKEK